MNTWDSLRLYLDYPFVQYALVTGTLIALCSSLLGVTLVLKRFSLIVDGLSHGAFGALGIATVLKLFSPMMFVLPVTILCAVSLLCTSRNSRIRGDASIAMLSVGSLAIGYMVLNVFGSSSNVSGDVCSTLFGSTSILTLTPFDVWLCVILSLGVVVFFILFYERIFALTFDETYARASGIRVGLCNLVLAIVVAIIIVLAMNLVGSLLISALIVFPALAAMRICRSFLSVTICSAVLSVGCALSGMLVAIVAGTPVGSTIVTADIIAFLICAAASILINHLRTRKATLALLSALAFLTIGCGSEKKPEPPPQEHVQTKEEDKVDLDLSLVNPRMVYMQVFYMMQQPQAYDGQTIRLKGTYAVTINKTTKERHTNCNVSDSMGCCSAMIRFNLADGQKKQPRNGEVITVRGKFEIIEENGAKLGVLQNAVLE